jgi:DnaK suppressor protein
MDPVRSRLEAEREAVLTRLGRLTGDFDAVVAASRDSNADDEHDPEGSTIAFERSQATTMVVQARRRLDEIEAALARIAAGTYGTCEVCGVPIPEERLVARPFARTCVLHAGALAQGDLRT